MRKEFVFVLSFIFFLSLAGCTIDAALTGEALSSSSSPLLGVMQISNPPATFTGNANIDLVPSSDLFVKYRYKMGVASTTDCTDSTGYSSDEGMTTTISGNVASYSADALVQMKVCVIGGNADGDFQSVDHAISYSWSVDTVSSVIKFETTALTVAENSSVDLKITIDPVKPYDVVVAYAQVFQGMGQDGTYMVDHDLAEGTIQIPAGQSSAVKTVHALSNVVSSQDKLLRVALKSIQSIGSARIDNVSMANIQILQNSGPTVQSVLKIAMSDDYGNGTMCAILSDNSLRCLGQNSAGQVGNGNNTAQFAPYATDAGVAYKDISVDAGSACGVTVGGVLKCWGSGAGSLTPVVVDSGVSYTKVSVGNGFACGITTAQTIKCWGTNWTNQLGDGTSTDQSSPVEIDSSTQYKYVAAGWRHACGITTGNILKCWGNNSWGQLGDGSYDSRSTPVVIDGTETYSKVVPGDTYTVALTSDGRKKQIGSGSVVVVSPGKTFIDIAKGLAIASDGTIDVDGALGPYTSIVGGVYGSGCAIHTNGTVHCFGFKPVNGDGVSSSSFTPLPTDQTRSFSLLAADGGMGIALDSNKNLVGWGKSLGGQPRYYTFGIDASGLIFDKIATGSSYSSGNICGLVSKKLYCNIGGTGFRPVDVNSNFIDVALRQTQGCAITESGVLKCWTNSLNDLTTIDAGVSYAKIAVGSMHSCAITTAGYVKCWGDNYWGELGDGTQDSHISPTLISDSATTYKSISTGDGGNRPHTCGVTTTGVLKCWGANQGGLGDGSYNTWNLNPTVIDSGVQYQSVASGQGWFDCGITSAGEIKCWGYFAPGGNLPALMSESGVVYKELALGDATVYGLTTTNVIKSIGSQLANGSGYSFPQPVLNLGH